jgi:hypothetical protein
MSDLSDYAAMIIRHNRLMGGKQGSRSGTTLCAATLSNRHDVFRFRCTKQVEITLADPVFDPQRQISRKSFWCPEQVPWRSQSNCLNSIRDNVVDCVGDVALTPWAGS